MHMEVHLLLRSLKFGPGRPTAYCGLIAMLSILDGCNFAPPYERPTPAIARECDTTGLEASAGITNVAQLEWQRFFGDARLSALIGIALRNNHDLKLAMGRVEEARALYGIQRADQLPNISAGALAGRAHLPADVSPSGRERTTSQYQATLNLSTWELDFWGRVRNLKDAALESYLATDEARQAVQISLIAQVANSYLLERELDERLMTAGQTLATREEAYRIMRRRFEVGSASKLDATQSELLRNLAQTELTILQRQRAQSRNALVLLAGAPLEAETRPLSDVECSFAQDIPPGLSSDLLLNRPDVLAAEHRLKAAHANIGAARAAFFPRIVLTGAFGTASQELDGLFAGGSRIWNFMPSLTLPIFDAGRNRANLDLSEARRHIAVAQYEQTVHGAFREVADALADRRWLAQQVKEQAASLAIQTERARLSQLRYQSGAAAYLEVLDAERDRFFAEQALVQTRRALLASHVNLYAALGGGAAPRADDAGQPRTTTGRTR